MVLGELYQPKGLALETAMAVLQVKEPYAVNVAWGCTNGCRYPCYNDRLTKGKITFPQKEPYELVQKQFDRGLEPEGVFLSFGTDCLLKNGNWVNTWKLVKLLTNYGVQKIAILSKEGVLPQYNNGILHGATIVSLSHEFRLRYEPKAMHPRLRLMELKNAHSAGAYTWLSIEPYPCPAIFEQDLTAFLTEFSFIDFMIFGKWNYDPLKRTNTPEAKRFYIETAAEFTDFCKDMGIRCHVKSDVNGDERWK